MAHTQRLKITVHLKSPLLITAQQVGFIWESEVFIPGSVLRGAVAQVAIRAGQDPALLFEHPAAPYFGPAWPGLTPPTGILPHTARTCKRHSGFRRDAQDNERHGVQDTLLVQAFRQATAEALCPMCEKTTLPWGGKPYTVSGPGEHRRYVSPRALMRRIGRTGVSRERAAVANRLLYTLEVIGEQMDLDVLDRQARPQHAETRFNGFVWVDEHDAAPWPEWLHEVTHIGGARSRGLGHVKVETQIAPLPEADPEEDFFAIQMLSGQGDFPLGPQHPGDMGLATRICAFNQMAYENGAPSKAWYLVVDLQSDALLSDAKGPQYTLTPQHLGLPEAVTPYWHLARYDQAGGWSAAWGLPKPVAPSLTTGSVFVYQVPRDKAVTQQVLKCCESLESEGVGQQREQGFGRVQICAPFHLEMEVKL